MNTTEEVNLALCLYDCLTPEERHQIHDLLKELSSGQLSADGFLDQGQQTT